MVADLLDLGEDVGAQNHRVLLGQLPDQGADLQDLLGVQAYSGLIQDQDVWEAQQRLGQPHPLAVALGQVADQPARTRRSVRVISRMRSSCAARSPLGICLSPAANSRYSRTVMSR